MAVCRLLLQRMLQGEACEVLNVLCMRCDPNTLHKLEYILTGHYHKNDFQRRCLKEILMMEPKYKGVIKKHIFNKMIVIMVLVFFVKKKHAQGSEIKLVKYGKLLKYYHRETNYNLFLIPLLKSVRKLRLLYFFPQN